MSGAHRPDKCSPDKAFLLPPQYEGIGSRPIWKCPGALRPDNCNPNEFISIPKPELVISVMSGSTPAGRSDANSTQPRGDVRVGASDAARTKSSNRTEATRVTNPNLRFCQPALIGSEPRTSTKSRALQGCINWCQVQALYRSQSPPNLCHCLHQPVSPPNAT